MTKKRKRYEARVGFEYEDSSGKLVRVNAGERKTLPDRVVKSLGPSVLKEVS